MKQAIINLQGKKARFSLILGLAFNVRLFI